MQRTKLPFLVTAVYVLSTALIPEAQAGVRLCHAPPGAEVPASARIAAADPRSDWDVPGGYNQLLATALQNRRAIANDPDGVEGVTAISGYKEFPVFPFAFANRSAPYPSVNLEQQLFTGPWEAGTLTEYYEEVSYGNLTIGGVVMDWVTVSEVDTYYEGSDNGLFPNTQFPEALHEVLATQDSAINFAQFDNDGPDGIPNSGDDDGYVDFVAFVQPEAGGEFGNDNIWAHASALSYRSTLYTTDDAAATNSNGLDFIRVNRYFVSGALSDTGSQAGIGTYAHEYGHAIGIPDLYDTNTDNGDSEGIGWWGLMGAGSWNTQDSPAHMTAWTKERLGWLSYHNVLQSEQLCLPDVETNPVAARLWTLGQFTPEYFVVENRQDVGFDQAVRSPGLVIYHVDESILGSEAAENGVNGDEAHKLIDVECADATTAEHISNADGLDLRENRGDAGDVWCSDTQVAFTETSIPDSRSYGQGPTGVRVVEIQNCDGNESGAVCAFYDVGIPSSVDLCMMDCENGDCTEISTCDVWWGSPDLWIDNNGDGVHDVPADGMTNKLWYTVRNEGPNPASSVQLSLYYSDPALGAIWPTTGTLFEEVTIPQIAAGQSFTDFIYAYYPSPPSGVDHYCIGAIATNAEDGQSSEYAPNDNNVAQVNHNILVERAGGAPFAGSGGGLSKNTKLMIYPGPYPVVFGELRLGTPPNFNDVEIPAGWNFEYNSEEFYAKAGEPIEMWVNMSAPSISHGQTAYVPVTLWNIELNAPAGGVFLEYIIDLYAPNAPVDLVSACIPPAGDGDSQPRVKLGWSEVARDVNDEPEIVKHYEIWRGDNDGNTIEFYETVAIDAEPSEPGFQYYDPISWTEDLVYTYQIRAIDRADAVGAFGAEIHVTCLEPASIDPTGANDAPLTYSQPNPFNPKTTIHFTLNQSEIVKIFVFDESGRRIKKLASREFASGNHQVEWDGRDQDGRQVASGIYFYRFETGRSAETRKMIRSR